MSRQELVVNIKCDLTSDEESSYFGEIKKEYPSFFSFETVEIQFHFIT